MYLLSYHLVAREVAEEVYSQGRVLQLCVT